MIVRGLDFGYVLNASGARGFFGEGYSFHKLVPGLSYRGSTFVAKTTTLGARAGNMPLRSDFRPREVFPKCVVVKPFKGVVLNSVGLSGPGIEPLLRRWESRHDLPWMISVMSVESSSERRESEMKGIAEAIAGSSLPANVGVQLNLSCPNAGLDPSVLVEDALDQVSALAPLGRPLFLKVNALFPVSAALEISRVSSVDGFVVSNTIPWGKLPDRIDWLGLFGSGMSPLAHIGGGGLSGAPLLPIVGEWIRNVRSSGVSKPIVGGGGILSPSDALALLHAGADAVELGSVSILRPWRVSSIIDVVNRTMEAASFSRRSVTSAGTRVR